MRMLCPSVVSHVGLADVRGSCDGIEGRREGAAGDCNHAIGRLDLGSAMLLSILVSTSAASMRLAFFLVRRSQFLPLLLALTLPSTWTLPMSMAVIRRCFIMSRETWTDQKSCECRCADSAAIVAVMVLRTRTSLCTSAREF